MQSMLGCAPVWHKRKLAEQYLPLVGETCSPYRVFFSIKKMDHW